MSFPAVCPFYGQDEETTNHLFKDCIFIASIWNTINYNCLNPLNYAYGITDWLQYLWSNKSLFTKNFNNPLEKVITIIWAVWNHRNKVIFKAEKCSSASILEMAKTMFQEITYENYYNSKTSSTSTKSL